jgi:hypothetical protein
MLASGIGNTFHVAIKLLVVRRIHYCLSEFLVAEILQGQISENVDLGELVVSVLATGPKVRGFDPDRGRWIFKGDKNPEHHFLRRGSKAVGPMS